jgi:hypothetical protein
VRRAFVASVLSVVVFVQLLAFPTASGADQWSPISTPSPPGTDGMTFLDNSQWGAISYIEASTDSTVNAVPEVQCSAFTSSGPCALNLPGTSGEVTAYLPVCVSATSTNCVASMSLGTSADSMVPSTYAAMSDGTTTPADPSLGIPAGSSEELWTNSLTNLGGTTTYATVVETQFSIQNGHVVNATLSAAINPYRQISEANPVPSVDVTPQGQVVVEGGSIDCAYTTATSCGRLEDFAAGTVASLSIRITNQLGGWFKGRLRDPTISETPFNATSNVISVSAGVATVPTVAFVAPFSQMESDVGTSVFNLMYPTPPISGYAFVPTEAAAEFIDDIRGSVNNTAAGQITVWNFATLQPGRPSVNGGAGSCLNNTNQVDGIVTTNAMAIQPGAPNVNGGYFSYGVAGMHYNADGSVAEGTYDLSIRSTVAQCLYGFSNAPISATVSVTEDSTGDQNVATTLVSDSHGWIHVGAYGFNFSDPTISVKLTQASPRIKRVTLTCVRRKVTKRITAVKPKCPSGYKKK